MGKGVVNEHFLIGSCLTIDRLDDIFAGEMNSTGKITSSAIDAFNVNNRAQGRGRGYFGALR